MNNEEMPNEQTHDDVLNTVLDQLKDVLETMSGSSSDPLDMTSKLSSIVDDATNTILDPIKTFLGNTKDDIQDTFPIIDISIDDPKVSFLRYKYENGTPMGLSVVDYYMDENDLPPVFESYKEAYAYCVDFILSNAKSITVENFYENAEYRVLYTSLLKLSNDIAVDTRRGAGNFILSSVETIKLIKSALDDEHNENKNDNSNLGRFTSFYSEQCRNDNAMIVGYTGKRSKNDVVVDTGICVIYVNGKFIPIVNQKTALDYYRVLNIE